MGVDEMPRQLRQHDECHETSKPIERLEGNSCPLHQQANEAQNEDCAQDDRNDDPQTWVGRIEESEHELFATKAVKRELTGRQFKPDDPADDKADAKKAR